ncbi:ATP-binding protein [Glaciecola petra]|uniref:histidine kinase n=1 Tax=Glaciecola petra TaxID=3075602 RepID=A0ABU2ZVI2_9ALTE|nr:ATP-binding protein [Aestuariibacter sp. P117]MDT0595594.1 ATP-binding protein [Aestuariibacter sp. P117]
MKTESMWETLNTLFSMVLVCNSKLAILRINSPLQKYIPESTLGKSINEVFTFSRPSNVNSLKDILQHKKSLFLLIKKDKSFALRGQMLSVEIDGSMQIVFVGSPWLAWLNINQPSLKLGLQDFAAADAQMDQLFYISTEQQMVNDLESLNRELLAAKAEVEAAQAETNAIYAQMSHEMRTPLNGVVSALAILAEQNLPSRSSELVSMANLSSKNLLKIINYVLDTARLEAGYVDDIRESFELRALLKSSIKIVKPHTLDKQLQLELSIEEDLPSYFFGFKERLRQVLLNLLGNAVKFTYTGSVTLIATKPKSSKYNIRLEVKDTGEGIAENDLKKIFKPFYTSGPKDNLNESGTGLGLDIVRRNVNALGGEIGVSSNIGEGSTFWMEIPLEIDEQASSVKSQSTFEPHKSILLNGDVLLVEDNKTNSALCKMLLESLGLTVRTEYSAESALASIDKKKPDLVFMDIGLPHMNGHQATEILRKSYSQEALPILALTAYTNSLEYEKSINAGMDDYLIKPVSKETFKDALVKWLPKISDTKEAKYLPDLAVLRQLESHVNINSLQKLVKQFCDEASADFTRMLELEDLVELAKVAHRLISPCDTFALSELAQQFRVIEEQAKLGIGLDLNQITSFKTDFEESLSLLQYIVNNELLNA